MTDRIPTPGDLATGARARKKALKATSDRYRRGDIWFIASDPDISSVGNEIWSDRPAIVVSNNTLNSRSGVATVVYMTTATKKRTGPAHVEVPSPTHPGMAIALCEQVHTVDASRLVRKLGVVPDDYLPEINVALALTLGAGRNPNIPAAIAKWERHITQFGIDMAKEIEALSGRTTDDRVLALTNALRHTAAVADAYRDLYEALPQRPSLLADVSAALGVERGE